MRHVRTCLSWAIASADVDSLGAGIGIYCAAKNLDKKAQIVINDPTSSVRPLMETFSEAKGYPADMFINSEEALEVVSKDTLVMVVDTNMAKLHRVS